MAEGIGLGMGFKLDAKLNLDSRKSFKTVEEMKNFPETSIPEGFTTFNEETALEYQFLSTNEVSETLGKWRVKEYGSGGPTSDVQQRCVVPYEDNKAHQANVSLVLKDSLLYLCKVTNQDATWTPAHWELIGNDIEELTVDDVKNFLSLTPQQLDTLASIISTEIRLDKCFSSSYTYMYIQDALNTAKEYVNNKLGKAVKPAYKVVSNTSEVTETGYFYLISNGTNYDMYVLSAYGSVVSLGTSEVDLSNYYTKTEVDNDFLKKTDATSTYATITTVDGKVDKTNVLTALGNSATDEQVYSAKAVNTELDKKANDDEVVKKTDISTSIDSTSTDDTVPSSKAVNDILSTVTGITNVPLTNIAIPSGLFETIDSISFIKYEVINGIVFLYFSIRNAKTAGAWLSANITIPKPKHQVQHTIISEGLTNGISIIASESSAQLWTLGNPTAITNYIACISYPLAKS